uniref:Uncharacterized protein n=1 Tax=Onchocerca volvulus TaxID=6282 RepID=A0A2K6W9E6_ONCVO
MGPLESKHAKHRKQSDIISEREKKSFLSRLRKRLLQRHASSCKHNRKRSSASNRKSEKSQRSYFCEDHRIEERRSKRLSEKEQKKLQKEGGRKVLTKHCKHGVEFPDGHLLHQVEQALEVSNCAREKIKAFFSRPMQDASVQKFVEKIKKRNELRKESTFKEQVPEIPLRRADEKFPLRHRVEKHEPEMREESDRIIPLKKSILRVTNKDNEGKLFDEDGLPFWSKFSKVQKDSEKKIEEATDEDLPMDSELLLEVQAGLRKLVKMPKIRIVMDPYAPLDYLKSRDKIFFTTEVIFSNTVRSMVNLNDEISNKEIISKRSQRLGKVLIEEPIKLTQYNENNPLIHEQISM